MTDETLVVPTDEKPAADEVVAAVATDKPEFDRATDGINLAVEISNAIIAVANTWLEKLKLSNEDLFDAMTVADMMVVESLTPDHASWLAAHEELVGTAMTLHVHMRSNPADTSATPGVANATDLVANATDPVAKSDELMETNGNG
jgi:hypothetical protein